MFSSRKKLLPPCRNVLTPDQIPPFFIPPSLERKWFRKRARGSSRRVTEVTGPSIADVIMEGPYLSESPHTRRRESLFHQTCLAQEAELGLTPGSDAESSADSSPLSSPFLRQRPPGSTPGRQTLARAGSLSPEEGSSADSSPELSSRVEHISFRDSASHLAPPPVLHLVCCRQRQAKEAEVVLSRGGLLRLALDYAEDLGRLSVKLVSAENLYPAFQDPGAISCCALLCLLPGKLQKQRSSVIRCTPNPIFNQHFYFQGVGVGELGQHRLKVKVVNRGTGLRRDTVLGGGEILLSSVLPL